MRKRRATIYERDPDDFYVEPDWCSRRLFEIEPFEGSIVDPSCGTGRVVNAARAAGLRAIGADKVRRCAEAVEADFLDPCWPSMVPICPDNIVSNPPFSPCNALVDGQIQFVDLCLSRVRRKVALLLPLGWQAGDGRSRYLDRTPLYRVRTLTPRPSMPPGAFIEAGGKVGGGTDDFAWYIWLIGYDGPSPLNYCRRDG